MKQFRQTYIFIAIFLLLAASSQARDNTKSQQVAQSSTTSDRQIRSIIDEIQEEIDQVERQAREIEIKAQQRAPAELMKKLEAQWREDARKEEPTPTEQDKTREDTSEPQQEKLLPQPKQEAVEEKAVEQLTPAATTTVIAEQPQADRKEVELPSSAVYEKETVKETPETSAQVSTTTLIQPPQLQVSVTPAVNKEIFGQPKNFTFLLSLTGVCLVIFVIIAYLITRLTKRVRLALKLASGFVISLIAVVVVVAAIFSLMQDFHLRQRVLTKAVSLDSIMMKTQTSLTRIRDVCFEYILDSRNSRQQEAAIEKHITAATNSITELISLAGSDKAGAEKLQNRYQDFLVNIRSLLRIHDEVFSYGIYVGDNFIDLENWILKTELEHMQWVGQLAEAIASDSVFDGELNPKVCSFGKLLYSYTGDDAQLRTLLQNAQTPHQQFHLLGRKINDNTDRAARVDIYNKELRPVVGAVKDSFEEIRQYLSPLIQRKNLEHQAALRLANASFLQTQEQLKAFEDLLRKSIELPTDVQQQSQLTLKIGIIIIGLAIIIVGGAFSIRLSFLLVQLMNERLRRLTMNANQATAVAGLLSQTSQHFLQRSSEQILSLQKLSGTLDTMRSMNAQSSNNARTAQRLVQSTQSALSESNRSIQNMQAALADINQSSEAITRMMKTIEDISFQTNLLALNAMVEALKAGEQGKGFAMVAENVCDLSRRTKEIIKDATALINDNIHKMANSAENAQRITESLKSVVDCSQKLERIVADIDTLSRKQTESTGDIAGVVNDISQATQKNTAIANESIFSSKELLAKVETLRGVLSELEQIAGGGGVFSHEKTTLKEPTQREVITYHDASGGDEQELHKASEDGR